jgi:quercetin dioxygenase-like cupin family protein
VAYDSLPRQHAVQQQIWLLEGQLQLTVGPTVHRLAPGDCLAMTLDAPSSSTTPATPPRYVVVLTRA